MTKGEVIRKAREYFLQRKYLHFGICYLLSKVMGTDKKVFGELYDKETIRRFNGNPENDYYWDKGVWDNGRIDFFNMLYEKYKDDPTEIQ